MEEINIPQLFTCPITRQLINSLVVASDGQFYEKSAIKRWLKSNKTSPLTGLQMDGNVYECRSFQQLLDNFYDKHPEITKKRFELSTDHRDNIEEISKIISKGQFDKLVKFKEFDFKLFKLQQIITIIEKTNIKIFAHIIQNAINRDIILDNNDAKLVHYICKCGSVDHIKLLVDMGIDLESCTKEYWKPIHYVCKYGSYDSIKLLVDKGVDLECLNVSKLKPIYFIFRYQPIETIKKFVGELSPINNTKLCHLLELVKSNKLEKEDKDILLNSVIGYLSL